MDEEHFEVECPSGLRGLVRPLEVRDVNALASRKARKQKGSDNLGRLLAGVWLKTLDAGPYGEVVKVGEPITDWMRMLLGDRSFLTLEARRLTYGDDFYFAINCKACKKRIEWHIQLPDLTVSGLSDEAREAFVTQGNDAVFHRKLPRSGATVGFRLLTGVDQRNVANAADEDGDASMQTAGLLARLPYIEGVTGAGERKRFVTRLHLMDAEFLREEWEEHDIFVQDRLEIECPKCDAIQEVAIPTDERFFSVRSTRPMHAKRSSD